MANAADDRSDEVLAVTIIFLVLVWISFPLRVWVRLRIIKNWGVDDWLTLFSCLFYTAYSAFVLCGVHWGTGKHVADLSPKALENALKAWFYCEVWYILSSAFLKVAVGAFLLRVAVHKSHRAIIYALIAINVVFNIYFFFTLLFQCAPVTYFWTRFSQPDGGSCVNPRMTADNTLAQSAISILTDFTFAILPIFIVKDLQLDKQKRFAVAIVLGLAALASIATIVRVPYVVTLTQTDDFLYATVGVAIWSTVEPGLGLTVISLATLRPLFRTFFSRLGLRSTVNTSIHGRVGDYSGDRNSRAFKTHSTSTRAVTPGDLEMHVQQKERQKRCSTFVDDDNEPLDRINELEKGVAVEVGHPPAAIYKVSKPVPHHDARGRETVSPTSLTYDANGLVPFREIPDQCRLGHGHSHDSQSYDTSPLGPRSDHRRLGSNNDNDRRGNRTYGYGFYDRHSRESSELGTHHVSNWT